MPFGCATSLHVPCTCKDMHQEREAQVITSGAPPPPFTHSPLPTPRHARASLKHMRHRATGHRCSSPHVLRRLQTSSPLPITASALPQLCPPAYRRSCARPTTPETGPKPGMTTRSNTKKHRLLPCHSPHVIPTPFSPPPTPMRTCPPNAHPPYAHLPDEATPMSSSPPSATAPAWPSGC